MMRSLNNISKIALFVGCLAMPASMLADDNQKAQTEMEMNQISISVSASNLRVKNADGGILQIYSITGELILTHKIDGQSKSYDLANLQHGVVYIVKIGNFTRKIYLR